MICEICFREIEYEPIPYRILMGNDAVGEIKKIAVVDRELALCNSCFRILAFSALNNEGKANKIMWPVIEQNEIARNAEEEVEDEV